MAVHTLVTTSALFAPLAPELQEALSRKLRRRRMDPDTCIYLRGDEARAFYGIEAGRVRFSAASPDGKEFVLDYADAGQWFGEIGLFDAGPRVVDAHTAAATELVELSRSDLLQICRAAPELPLRFIELFSARIRVAEEIIVDAAFLTLPARLAKRLLALAEDPSRRDEPASSGDDRGAQVAQASVRISQDELGRLTGVTRESAGRQLKSWEREGLVALEYGRVHLLDAAALRRIVVTQTGG